MSEIKLIKTTHESAQSEKAIIEVPEPIGSITLNSRNIPEISKWIPGQDYTLKVRVRMDGSRIPDKWELENEHNDLEIGDVVATFSIIRASSSDEISTD